MIHVHTLQKTVQTRNFSASSGILAQHTHQGENAVSPGPENRARIAPGGGTVSHIFDHFRRAGQNPHLMRIVAGSGVRNRSNPWIKLG
jgi:hypothetical protein